MKAEDLLPVPTVELEEECDAWIEATGEFEEAARYLDLEPWIVHRLRHEERAISVNLPLRRDRGDPATITAFRVQHFTGRGPTLGEMCFSSQATVSAVKAAALTNTWKLALLNLPFGGAAGAVLCDAAALSEVELQTIAKEYARALRGIMGAGTDVVAPGMGCNPQTMAWLLDVDGAGHLAANTAVAADVDWSAVAGKPPALFGISGYYDATALGILALMEQALGNVAGRRIAVQGFGALGASVARVLCGAGARLIAVADVSGGLLNHDGIDLAALEKHAGHTRLLFGYPGAEAVCNEDVLECACDVLVLAAAERQLVLANAGRIGAPLVIEATRSAVTRAAAHALEQRGKTLVPEMLAAGGAAVVSFVEWAQNTRMVWHTEAQWHALLTSRMQAAYAASNDFAQRHELSLAHAARVQAVERVASGLRLR